MKSSKICYYLLKVVKGIGENKAEAIIDKIYECYDNKTGENNTNG